VTLTVHKLGLDAQFLGPGKNVHSARHLHTEGEEIAGNSTDLGRG
jgi:hypothetical protein